MLLAGGLVVLIGLWFFLGHTGGNAPEAPPAPVPVEAPLPK